MASDRFFVKTLTLENFRCFEKIELGPFDPHFNLLVGTNGSGKSSVLLALANLFQQIANLPSGIAMDRLVGGPDVRIPDQRSAATPHLPGGTLRGEMSVLFQWDGTGFNIWERFGGERVPGRTFVPPPLLEQDSGQPVGLTWPETDRVYPLILRFTTYRHFQWRVNIGENGAEMSTSDRWNALRGWTNAGATADELRLWMRDETLIALQRNETVLHGDSAAGIRDQLNVVQQACRDAVEGAAEIQYDGRRKDIVVSFADGRELQFSAMSDGQRALVGMVAEIARRATTLNWDYLEERSLRETPGLVLIDELDLHLHPKWQRRVIGDLKRIFPNIQFFATTHSPQIIGEARPEEIVMLTPSGQKRPTASYGMNSDWVLECVMEAEGRDPEIAKRIKMLFEAIENSRFDEAQEMIAELRNIIGESPDIVAAESYIWNVEHDGEEAAE